MIKFFDPGLAYKNIKPEMDSAMHDVLSRGDLVLRKDLDTFEENLAKYVSTKFAVGLNSGTDALLLSLMYYNIGPKSIVLCPSYTFRATVDSALRTGAQVKLYDIDEIPSLDGIDVFMPAHIAGEVPEWMEEKIAEARKKGKIVIEDAAQAIGAAPIRGDAACYSFYPAKILGCYGDGGAVATNHEHMYKWLKRARNHFKGERGPVGLNSRLDNLQAAVLNVKMKYLPYYIKRRKEIAELYDSKLGKYTIMPSERKIIPNQRAVYQDYIIELGSAERCDGLYEFLAARGIETMRNGYPFADCVNKGAKTVDYESRTLRLPCSPELTDAEVLKVCEMIEIFFDV